MSSNYEARAFTPYAETRDATNPWSFGAEYETNVGQADFGDMVADLRDNGLPITAIADLMRVERKSVYAWLSGSQPRQDARDRMADAYPILKDAFSGQYKTMYRLWKLKDADGATLESFCTAETIDAEALKTFVMSFEPTIRRYARQDAQRKPVVGGRNPLVDDFPVADS